MLLKTYIRSYLQIPVIQGIGLYRSQKPQDIYIFKSNQLLSIEEQLKDQIREYKNQNPEKTEFILPTINQWVYSHAIEGEVNFITIALHDNQVIRNFRAQQLQKKIAENLDESFSIFNEIQNDLLSNFSGLGESENPKLKVNDNLEKDIQNEVIEIHQVLDALNTLSTFTSGFIGPRIISNFWNCAKPSHALMELFHIRHTAEIIFHGSSKQVVSPLEILTIRQWTQNFMQKCDGVIRDLPKHIETAGFTNSHRKIISIYTPEYLHQSPVNAEEADESLFGNIFE